MYYKTLRNEFSITSLKTINVKKRIQLKFFLYENEERVEYFAL